MCYVSFLGGFLRVFCGFFFWFGLVVVVFACWFFGRVLVFFFFGWLVGELRRVL